MFAPIESLPCQREAQININLSNPHTRKTEVFSRRFSEGDGNVCTHISRECRRRLPVRRGPEVFSRRFWRATKMFAHIPYVNAEGVKPAGASPQTLISRQHNINGMTCGHAVSIFPYSSSTILTLSRCAISFNISSRLLFLGNFSVKITLIPSSSELFVISASRISIFCSFIRSFIL